MELLFFCTEDFPPTCIITSFGFLKHVCLIFSQIELPCKGPLVPVFFFPALIQTLVSCCGSGSDSHQQDGGCVYFTTAVFWSPSDDTTQLHALSIDGMGVRRWWRDLTLWSHRCQVALLARSVKWFLVCVALTSLPLYPLPPSPPPPTPPP